LSLSPNGISIGSAVVAQLSGVSNTQTDGYIETDRQADRQTPVAIGL